MNTVYDELQNERKAIKNTILYSVLVENWDKYPDYIRDSMIAIIADTCGYNFTFTKNIILSEYQLIDGDCVYLVKG